MTRLRGEAQPGFVEILSHWLPQQSWFPTPRGRWRLTRVGGLRLPAPAAESDSGLLLELHVLEIDAAESNSAEPVRVAVPLALRSRPAAAAAGKKAFIGRLSVGTEPGSGSTEAQAEELWVYDGLGDRAFVTAWAEMARKNQGSRNGRSRGEALGEYAQWPAWEISASRRPQAAPSESMSRMLVVPDGVEDSDVSGSGALVDVLRHPAEDLPETLQCAVTLTKAHSVVIPRVLGLISCAWEDREFSSDEYLEWQSGVVGVVREASTAAPSVRDLAQDSLRTDSSFVEQARAVGHALGTLHADLAGSFGSYPQSAEKLHAMAAEAQRELSSQWHSVRPLFDEDEAADLNEVIDLMRRQLRDADEAIMLQRIHGAVTSNHIHRVSEQRWVISEAGGMREHAAGMHDLVTVLMSVADQVMEEASRGAAVAPQNDQDTQSDQDDDANSSAGAGDSRVVPPPVNFGQWYEEVSAAVVEGYRESEAEGSGVDSVIFRAIMLTEALALFSRWDGRWVFRPSMLSPSDT